MFRPIETGKLRKWQKKNTKNLIKKTIILNGGWHGINRINLDLKRGVGVMQTSLKEIRERHNFITSNPDMVNNRVVYPTLRKIADDVQFLLYALEQLQIKLSDQEDQLHYRELLEKSLDTQRNHTERLNNKLQQSQDRERVLRDAVNSLIGLCENVGDFSNGNTYNEIDEGNVMAERFIDHIKSNIKALEDKPNDQLKQTNENIQQ